MMVAAAKTPGRWISGLLVAACAVLGGCQTVHEVMVDAISNQAKPMGTSYRLEVRDPSGGVDKALGMEAVASVKEALAARGLYEAPARTQPDMVIEFEYGVGPGQIKILHGPPPVAMEGGGLGAGDPGYGDKPVIVFEKYFTLSAREPVPEDPAASRGRSQKRGDELWNLHVSVEDQKKDLAPYLPVLASVSVDYMGENSVNEKRVVVNADEAASSLHHRQAQAGAVH